MLSKFNGTSTPKGSYRVKTGDNDYNVNSSRYSLSTTLCESIRYQAKSEQNVPTRPDTQGAPRGGCSLHPLSRWTNQVNKPIKQAVFAKDAVIVSARY